MLSVGSCRVELVMRLRSLDKTLNVLIQQSIQVYKKDSFGGVSIRQQASHFLLFLHTITMTKSLVRTAVLISLSIGIYQIISLRSFLIQSDGEGCSRRAQLALGSEQDQQDPKHATSIIRDPVISPSQCGKSWESLDLSTIRPVDPFIWSVSGGSEYRKYAVDILKRWETVALANVLVIALDQETADHLCQRGYESVLFDRPLNSYSKVVDAKLQVSRELSDTGINNLFIEMDIFCRSSPLPDLLELNEPNKKHDIVVLGHNNNHEYSNIGMWGVRASPRMSHFFERLVEILAPSKDEREYENENGKTKEWFDQDIFNWCLQSSIFPQVKMGDEVNACASVNVTSSFVSPLVISSNEPPLVVDQTKCIHPLMGSPFSSFTNKLNIAKTLGFDLTDIAADERLLKTTSGEFTYFDNIRFGIQSWHWSDRRTKHKFLYHFSALVALAKLSNRTLVLPHNLMTLDTKTLPVYSLVNMVTVEKHVSWRWEVPSDIQDRSTVVIHPHSSFKNITRQVASSASQVSEIEGLLFLQLGKSSTVLDIMKNLTWCVDDRFSKGETFHYRGGRDWLCDDNLARPFVPTSTEEAVS